MFVVRLGLCNWLWFGQCLTLCWEVCNKGAVFFFTVNDYFCQDTVFYISIIALALGLVVFFHTIYFQIRYQKKVDKLINGDNYIDGGWIFNTSRMMIYAHYCLFPKRASRAGVTEAIQNMPAIIRWHLIGHWGVVISACLLAVFAYFGVNSLEWS